MLKKKNEPEIVKLSSKNIDEIQLRLTENSLNEEDRKILSIILTTYQWLFRQLQLARFSIRKLKSVFGFKTEKRDNLQKSNPPDSSHLTTNSEKSPNALTSTANDPEDSSIKKR